jgi:hypothetical protein
VPDDWKDGLESACDVRELPYQASGHALGIDGGENGGMTVMGWDRKEVRVLYRIKARAATNTQAEQLAQSVRVERGWWLTPRACLHQAAELVGQR